MTPFPAAGSAPVLAEGADAPQLAAECHIWSLPPLRHPSSWFGLLDSTELLRCSSFAHELDLARFVTGRMLAKTALASLVGTSPEAIRFRTRCTECGGPHGKPHAVGAGAGWELSISHSGDIVAVAIALGSPLGLDVEQAEPWSGPELPPEYELVLTPVERAAVEALPEERRARACLTYWTRKEAVLKATGEGLNTPMTDFTLSGPEEPPTLLTWHPPDATRPVPALADVRLGEDCHGAVAALGVRSVLPTVHSSAELLPAGQAVKRTPHAHPVRIISTERPPPGSTGRARSPAGAPH
ncbi:4'-phosphopantetheinyl transferase family protein [Streptomyces sporangiiformans]|uniref:4'-phosphopantetheinyl transferase superfamily protein n=1 Tax=Streptomyces sporangiiformans TaxID=2315329 RepID=A0A505DEF5_9ACTN|nr:4'-phosphopantetheinyl transferase superfamily protein [Streptomyces sporangiiformans]TPQ22184.1 4'-phosphopantetheinyl transferase superfamily protein [Streptomyces sporangiiformans]